MQVQKPSLFSSNTCRGARVYGWRGGGQLVCATLGCTRLTAVRAQCGCIICMYFEARVIITHQKCVHRCADECIRRTIFREYVGARLLLAPDCIESVSRAIFMQQMHEPTELDVHPAMLECLRCSNSGACGLNCTLKVFSCIQFQFPCIYHAPFKSNEVLLWSVCSASSSWTSFQACTTKTVRHSLCHKSRYKQVL